LVADLSVAQLAGVLAHELGHAAQATIGPSRFISSVHAWLSRVAFERDEIDEHLLKWLLTAGPGTRLGLRLVQVLIQAGRMVLRLLKMVEGVVSSVFLRRIELDADRYQVRVAGTEAFISTVLELNLLEVAAQRAVVEVSRMWRKRPLVDNYPGLIASLRGGYSEEFERRLLAGLEQGKTHLFSAHPCDKDRIALARAEKSPGIVNVSFPAAALFADYRPLCREVTVAFYEQEFGLPPETYQLAPFQDDGRESGPR